VKILKLFSILLILFIFLSFFSIGKKFISSLSPSIPFVYGLDVKKVSRVNYLKESNSTILPIDKFTVGVYSLKKNNFFLKEIFQTAGVPYYFTTNLKELNRVKIIFLDFNIDKPTTLTKEQNRFFHSFVKRGGILIGNEILPTRYGVLKDIFGYKAYKASKEHKEFKLLKSQYFTYLNEPQERVYRLSNLQKAPFTNTIILGSAKTVATYEDNTTAISINNYGNGKAINLGISLFDLRYRNLFAKDFHANKKYINDFEPLSDFIILFIKGIYESEFKRSIFLHTSKNGNQATVVMSHDIDFDDSIKNISKFTKLEKNLGFRATYNIQVKYITDDKDRAFFKPENFKYILDAQNSGHEIGSHTILHTKNFFLLPKGDCNESYPKYKPFSEGEFEDSGNPTVCGEVKASKELLLGIGVKEVVSFRSGELLYNPNLPEVLEESGYRYSSCFSAEDTLTYFPYRYMRDYKSLSNPSKIWEIPLVLEDEFFPPLYFRVDSALELYKKIYDNGALFNILDHPDLTLYKLKNLDLKFIKEFYKKLPKDSWLATTKDIGEFWDKRDRVVFRYKFKDNKLYLKVYSLADIKGLTFVLNNFKVKEGSNIKVIKNKLVLDVKKGINSWELNIY